MILRLAVLLAVSGAMAEAVTCGPVEHRGTPFTVCEVDPAATPVRLYLENRQGEPFGSFRAVEAEAGPLALAMNAGMYHSDRSPVGHYVESGREVMRVIPNAGPGNFGMLPNGVLCIGESWAKVWETQAFLEARPDCVHATQSGPMLVIGGTLHPRFIEGSDSTFVRNGVGTSSSGDRVVFAISDAAVNFHDFATLFRDVVGVPDALYFDGKVSRLHVPEIGRSDSGFAMGPIVAVPAAE